MVDAKDPEPADESPPAEAIRQSPGSAQAQSPDKPEAKPGAAEPGKSSRDWTVPALVVIVAVLVVGLVHNLSKEEVATLELTPLSQETATLPDALSNRGLPLDELYQTLSASNLETARAYVGFYSGGRWGGEAWGSGAGLQQALTSAYESALASNKREPDTAVVVIPTGRIQVKLADKKRYLSNIHRGVRGLLVQDGQDPFLLSPTKTVATNRTLVKALERAAKKRNTTLTAWLKAGQVYVLDARQFIVPLAAGEPAREMVRGNTLVKTEDVTQASVREFERKLSDWMFQNLMKNGRMTYMYYPSEGKEPKRQNNMIRQWMGTVAMGRIAKLHPERNVAARVEQNIRFNLKAFYRTEGEHGFIEYSGKAKLGAAALALISLIESPAREAFAAEESGLRSTIDHLWEPTGAFRTFYKPKTRNDNHNFYPGEALLAWAFLYADNQDPALLDKIMKSFRYYKKWHLEHRNPAFIPWHTQAYYTVWQHTKSEELRDWVFTMNDWLIDTMQKNSRVATDDTIGRFYDPISNKYGPPHASSTGVYLEGLIDAFALARATGDKAHQEKYRRSIVLGLRSSMQLQFADDIDMFYISERDRVRGGMRTTVYNNVIRVDNVQHVLMGVQKILREMAPEDYQLN